ncbi:MAG: Rhomboid family protein [Acidobacteriales bacterium]|nr:Rhomboid family protein [Terriglobales bacterium]
MANCATCGTALQTSPFGGTEPICVACEPASALAPAQQNSPESEQQLSISTADQTFRTTTYIVLANVLYYLYFVAMIYARYGQVLLGPIDARFYLLFGADQGQFTFGGQYWRLLASNYIHFGVYHLLGNMWCLWGLGRLTQLFYSPRNYFMVYTYAGLCGSLLSVWAHPQVISAGASGAVFGVAGVMLTTLQFGKLPIDKQVRQNIFKGVLQFAALNLVIGLAIPHVDNIGHIGGLLSGMLLGIVFGKHLDSSKKSRKYRRVAWLSLIFFYLLALIYVAFTWNGVSFHVTRT